MSQEASQWTQALMSSRRTVLPKRLVAPGPDAAQTQALFAAAATAPDHGQIKPWRYRLIPTAARAELAERFADALVARDAQATPQQIDQAREKAHRAPWLAVLIVRLSGLDEAIAPHERLISAGAGLQNLLLMAQALGFSSGVTSGKALADNRLRQWLGLDEAEQAVCFVSIGTATKLPGPAAHRPAPSRLFDSL